MARFWAFYGGGACNRRVLSVACRRLLRLLGGEFEPMMAAEGAAAGARVLCGDRLTAILVGIV